MRERRSFALARRPSGACGTSAGISVSGGHLRDLGDAGCAVPIRLVTGPMVISDGPVAMTSFGGSEAVGYIQDFAVSYKPGDNLPASGNVIQNHTDCQIY